MQATLIQEESGIQEYRLSNGLKVLLVENNSAPVATVPRDIAPRTSRLAAIATTTGM